jgi:hypothetical protein
MTPAAERSLANTRGLKAVSSSLVTILLAALVLGCSAVSPTERVVITLNPELTYQTLTGWEGTAQSGELACSASARSTTWPNVCPAFSKYKDSLFDQVVDLGITRIRLEIYPGVENKVDYFAQFLGGQITGDDWVHGYGRSPQNDDSDPNSITWSGFHFTMLDYTIETEVLPLSQRVRANGDRLLVNLCFVHFGSSATGFYQYEQPAEYAEFMLATYQHMQAKYGFVPDSIEVMLEPDNTRFDGTKMGNAIQATIARLEEAGFSPHFIVPSTTNMSNVVPYFNAIKNVLGDAGVRRYVQEISYHRYRGVSDDTLRSIATTASSYGLGASMLEWIGGSYPELYKDLTLGNNTAWAQYAIASPYFWGTADDGGSYFNIDDTDPNSPKIHMASRTKFIRQYTKFIRPGAVRVDVQSANSLFEPVAFRNSAAHGGGYALVVKAQASGQFSVEGLPTGTYGTKYTTSSQYNIDQPDVTIFAGEALDASIPDAGVITVYAKPSQAPADNRALLNQCSLKRNSAGTWILIVLGSNIRTGATVTVGGAVPKKIKFKDEIAPGQGIFTRLKLKKKFCSGLPGSIVVTNPDAQPSEALLCEASCSN